ncbi:UNVERIFIED_CONTAM: hypothetical protein GTU68_005293 [Idotea baltica]|nr:hypothetical protein [Idotea baltica]
MGETGPCGPCSEMHYYYGDNPEDQTEESFKSEIDFLEFWNLVFMQFNRDEAGVLTPLPKPSIDTGMGLERITAILQGKTANYDTDLLNQVIKKCEELTKVKYLEDSQDIAMRVIADHSRAMSFLIAEGITPGSEGRSYVLRRIMRRAIRHGKALNFKKPFLKDTCKIVIETMSLTYPELKENQKMILKIVDLEENKFHETLDSGLNILKQEASKAKGKNFSGKTAFTLHDTYGFPLDLTEDALKEYDLKVNLDEFNLEMSKQKERSRIINEKAILKIDAERRNKIETNHSATHLLQSGLRKFLGEHVKQSGSRVDENNLRFDYSHFESPSKENLNEIQEWINQEIRNNYSVDTEVMNIEDAKKKGATALFGEKYGDTVRVVEIGPNSLELCGGTHVKQTGEIGLLLIDSETSIASGIRRITCKTSGKAIKEIEQVISNTKELAQTFKTSEDKVNQKVNEIVKLNQSLNKENEALKSKLASLESKDLINNVKITKSGVKVLTAVINKANMNTLKTMLDDLKIQIGSGVIALGSNESDKTSLVTGVTSDLKLHAGDLIKNAVKDFGGKGGGRQDFAQAGGIKSDNLSEALDNIFSQIN